MLLTEIRKKFQKRLSEKSLDFVSEITTDSIELEESQLQDKRDKNISEPLKKITITGLKKCNLDKIWKLNLEPDSTLLKSSAKVTEVAFVMLSHVDKLTQVATYKPTIS